MEQKKRLAYIDIVAGITISCMIIGHCGYFSHYHLPFGKFFSFYMPWFFYKSGFLFHSKDQKQLFKKDCKKYIHYFIIYSLLGWVVWSICGLIDHSLQIRDCIEKPIRLFIHRGCIQGNGALWFLISLFFVRQIGFFFINRKIHPLFISIVGFGGAFTLYYLGWHNHSWWFGNILSGLCFFAIGYWIKGRENNTYLFFTSAFILGLIIIAYFLGVVNQFPTLYMHKNAMNHGNYILFFLMATAAIITINNIFQKLCVNAKLKVLEYVGQQSMYFYVLHWILFTFICFIVNYLFKIESPAIQFYILLVSSIFILPILCECVVMLKSKYRIINRLL